MYNMTICAHLILIQFTKTIAQRLANIIFFENLSG